MCRRLQGVCFVQNWARDSEIRENHFRACSEWNKYTRTTSRQKEIMDGQIDAVVGLGRRSRCRREARGLGQEVERYLLHKIGVYLQTNQHRAAR